MVTDFIGDRVWDRLRKVAIGHRGPAFVAVAYFAKGASALLPLRRGSMLVVDAGERAVKTGQTHPNDLKKLRRKGVRIFSRSNLHAKVFVFGRRAFVGSANASQSSSEGLIEALIETSAARTVRNARRFVERHCLVELGPDELSRLQRKYQGPKGGVGRRAVRPHLGLPGLRVTRLVVGPPPPGSEQLEAAGERAARARRERLRTHEVDWFSWSGPFPFKRGELVMQITKEPDERRLVTAPGKILHTTTWRRNGKLHGFVYLEVPRRNRVALARLERRIGGTSVGRLTQAAAVSARLAERLLAAWQD